MGKGECLLKISVDSYFLFTHTILFTTIILIIFIFMGIRLPIKAFAETHKPLELRKPPEVSLKSELTVIAT